MVCVFYALICGVVIPWNSVWIKVLVGVSLSEQLHPQDGKNVDNNNEEKCQVAQSTQG